MIDFSYLFTMLEYGIGIAIVSLILRIATGTLKDEAGQ